MNQETALPVSKKSKLAHPPATGEAATSNGHKANGHAETNGSTDSSHRTSQGCIELEEEYSAHNYHPMPVVFSRAEGAHVFDPEGKRYIDCLSAYSAVNQVSNRPGLPQISSLPHQPVSLYPSRDIAILELSRL